MVLPLVKLGTLALKTLSKPVASKLKQQAAIHSKFRKLIVSFAQIGSKKWQFLRKQSILQKTCPVPASQPLAWNHRFLFHSVSRFRLGNSIREANHRITTQMQRRIYSHSTDVEIRPLNEEKAVQAAVDLIGELFVFTVAGALVVFEVQRSAKSEAKKEEIRRQELETMRQRDEELAKEVELLRQKFEEVEKLAKAKGLGGIFHLRNSFVEEETPVKPA